MMSSAQPRQSAEHQRIAKAVSAIIAVVVGLTFLSVPGLLPGRHHLALNGASAEDVRPARCLLIFATLALNVSAPLLAAVYGKGAFDAVVPQHRLDPLSGAGGADPS